MNLYNDMYDDNHKRFIFVFMSIVLCSYKNLE